jgi:Fe2+ transport system protein FeoA
MRVCLYEAKKRSEVLIVSVPESKTFELLNSLGVRVGTRVKIQNRYAFGGAVLLRVEDTYSVALGKDVAKQITVVECRDMKQSVIGVEKFTRLEGVV